MTSPRRRWTPGSGNDLVLILVLWLIVAGGLLLAYRGGIAHFLFPDPDDALRLVQVRDLIAGQAFYDVSQYRINPAGGGGDLHWSRFIDVQIVAMIELLSLFLPASHAERWAAALYPLSLILPLLLLFRAILVQLGDRLFVRVGLLLAATSFSFLHYFVPLRIDHHGWQLLLALALLALALGQARYWRGVAAAFAATVYLEISLEGLPYLVIFAALFAVQWLRTSDAAPGLQGFAAGIALLPPLWIGGWRGADALTGAYCDAFSRPFLAGSTVTGAVLVAALCWRGSADSRAAKLLMLAAAAAAGAIGFVMAGPACLDGPFGDLSPLVRSLWYESTSEGMPIWKQSADIAVSFALPSFIGFGCLLWSARRMETGPQSENWRSLLLVSAGSLLMSLLVLRATATTHAYLVPGYVLLAIGMFRWGQCLRSPFLRVPATAMAFVATPVAASALAVGMTMITAPRPAGLAQEYCINPASKALLNHLPPAVLFTPLDIAPAILVGTRHSVIASGHHRNHRAIDAVLTAFMAPPAEAEAIMRRAQADYVLVCRKMPEYDYFVAHAPQGFTAQLQAGRIPAWLRLDPAHSRGEMMIYRLLPPQRAQSGT